MGDKKDDRFMSGLTDRIRNMKTTDYANLIALLQEDIEGKTQNFSSAQIHAITELLELKTMKNTLSQDTIREIVEFLISDKNVSKMHLFDRKGLSKFVLLLSKQQTAELAQFLVPFFQTYTNKFMQSLSEPQQKVVFNKLLPSIIEWLNDEQRVKLLTMKVGEPPNRKLMYQRSDIATALEFVEKDMKKMSMDTSKNNVTSKETVPSSSDS